MKPAYLKIVEDTPLPKMALVSQSFPSPEVADVGLAVREAMASCAGAARLKPGMSVALTVGSRGIASLADLVREITAALKERGAIPFIVPSMGSHGGATAEGQLQMLAELGITEASAGCPIRSSMETVPVGTLANGLGVHIDKLAHEADGIVLFNRIKPHNSFRWANESGLVKMLGIGLGKQHGADACHSLGFGRLGEIMTQCARVKLATCNILFGLGTLENAYDRLMEVRGFDAADMIEKEQAALACAARNMPRLPLGDLDAPMASGPLDVLVVDTIGKEFSGGGMDANITGRFSTPHASGGPTVSRLVVLDLSERSHGNAAGIGVADMTTERLFQKFNREAVYTNCLTAANPVGARMPIVMPTDRAAIQAAVKTCHAPDLKAARMLRIPNSLHLGKLYVSEAMLDEVARRPGVTVLEPPAPMAFNERGELAPFPAG